ncbi:MAG: helix-turn-helix transcriptional regulator [Ruminococcaceae bacterium]|nr:helix-turn-helix transcriptional regulator [Oscillospiraceae bacterium]
MTAEKKEEENHLKIISFEKLYNTEFFIREPRVKKQNWFYRGGVFDSLERPKPNQTVIWFKNCSAELLLPDGECIDVAQNALLYAPKGTRYKILFHGEKSDGEDVVAAHFQMTDRAGEDIVAAQRPVVCLEKPDLSTGLLFDALAEECEKNVICIPEVNAGLYKILAQICQKQKKHTTGNRFSRIRKGIELLEGNNSMSIAEIAAACEVSECYFRRLFREYSGESPVGFRQQKRIERAKQLLLSDEHYTIGEVAAELGFLDIYHFSKTFKKLCGVSPNRFLKSGGET